MLSFTVHSIHSFLRSVHRFIHPLVRSFVRSSFHPLVDSFIRGESSLIIINEKLVFCLLILRACKLSTLGTRSFCSYLVFLVTGLAISISSVGVPAPDFHCWR